MKLISPFKDFYDIYDGDKEPVFVRKTEETYIEKGDLRAQSKLGIYWSYARDLNDINEEYTGIQRISIAFCGKVYIWWKYGNHIVERLSAIEDIVRENMRIHMGRHSEKYFDSQLREDKASKTPVVFELNDEVFRAIGTPYFSLRKAERNNYHVLTTCPNLHEMNIDRIWRKDHTWQEISMYLGNQLAQEIAPPVARTQELIRDAHGFNNQSFKTDAPGQRKTRRANRK